MSGKGRSGRYPGRRAKARRRQGRYQEKWPPEALSGLTARARRSTGWSSNGRPSATATSSSRSVLKPRPAMSARPTGSTTGKTMPSSGRHPSRPSSAFLPARPASWSRTPRCPTARIPSRCGWVRRWASRRGAERTLVTRCSSLFWLPSAPVCLPLSSRCTAASSARTVPCGRWSSGPRPSATSRCRSCSVATTSASWSTRPPSGLSSASSREMVDRYRLLTELSPDVVFVHQDGQMVYGNRAAATLMGAQLTDASYIETVQRYYGRPITDFIEPDDIPEMAERLSRSPSPVSSSSTARSAGHSRAAAQGHGGHQHPHDLGREPAYQVIAARHLRAPGGRGRQPLPGQPGGPRLRRHHRDRRRRQDRELERGRPGHLRLDRGPRYAGLPSVRSCSGNRTDSAAVLERGQSVHNRKDGSEVSVLVSIDPLIDDAPIPRDGWSCAPSTPTPGKPKPDGGRPRSAMRRWWRH